MPTDQDEVANLPRRESIQLKWLLVLVRQQFVWYPASSVLRVHPEDEA